MILGFAQDQPKLGPSVGAGYECRFGKILSFRTGLMYNERGGYYRSAVLAMIFGLSTDYLLEVKSHHLSVPVLLGVASTGNTYGFGRFGAMFSYLLDVSAKEPTIMGGTTVIGNRNIKESFNSFDVVGVIEGGIGGSLGNRVVLEGAVAMQIGMTNAVKTQRSRDFYLYNAALNRNDNTGRAHLGVSMMLAVKYRLGRKAKD